MKNKIFSFAAIMTCLLSMVGCTSDELGLSGAKTLSATIVDGRANETRTTVLDNPGVHIDMYWKGGDRIGLFAEGISNKVLTVDEGAITNKGKTVNLALTESIPGTTLQAYVPYQSESRAEADKMVLTLPSHQTYTVARGLPQPDPESSIMVGNGTTSYGMQFRTVLSVLKIGQEVPEGTVIRSVEFRDLSGEAVCGSFETSWNGGDPSFRLLSGGGKVITLDCKTVSVLSASNVQLFYLIVPPRHYAKGFEITFVTDAGERIVKTVGTTMGKTLERGVVYPIGAVGMEQVPEGCSYELFPEAIVMTPENLEKVSLKKISEYYIKTADGEDVLNELDLPVFGPQLELMVHGDLHPKKGGWLMFNQPTDDLPEGGIFRIETCEESGDGYYLVSAVTEANPFAAFKSLSIGAPIYDEGGNYNADGGVPLDISNYIKEVVDKDGKPMEFTVSEDGSLLFGDAVEESPTTRSSSIHNLPFSTPPVGFAMKERLCEVSMKTSAKLSTRIAIGVILGETQYMQVRFDPEVKLKLGFALTLSGSIDKEVHLFTVNTLPVPVCGVLVSLKFEVYATAGVGGEVRFQTSISATQSLGSYSVAYNKGDGTTFRCNEGPMTRNVTFEPSFDGATGSIHAYGGLSLKSYVSFYRFAHIGLSSDFKAMAGHEWEAGLWLGAWKASKLFVRPELSFTPELALSFLGIKGAHKFKDLTGTIDLEPWWEKYLLPGRQDPNMNPIEAEPKYEYKLFSLRAGDYEYMNIGVPTRVKSIHYRFPLKGNCLNDVALGLLIYECDGVEYDLSHVFFPQDKPRYEAYIAAGMGHVMELNNTDVTSKFLNPKPVAIIRVDTYPADVEEKVVEGDFHPAGTYQFHSRVPYGIRPVIIDNPKYEKGVTSIAPEERDDLKGIYIMEGGGKILYSWPNTLNGVPYTAYGKEIE